MEGQQKQTIVKKKTVLVILLDVLFILLGLSGAMTGAFAWFVTNRSFETTVSSFQISAEPGINFELYYLDHFTVGLVEKDGNWNSSISSFAGYETAYEDSDFELVEYEDGVVTTDPNPTQIEHLWPAHRLTFAVLITSGEVSSFSVRNWSETTNANVVVGSSTEVRISWAINIYGAAYSVAKQVTLGGEFDPALTIEEGYKQIIDESAYNYHSGKDYRGNTLTDAFTYDETENPSPTGSDKPSVPVFSTSSDATCVPAVGADEVLVVFFSIEFSDDSATYYRLDTDSSYDDSKVHYVKDSLGGNSNCYENLSLDTLEFSIN